MIKAMTAVIAALMMSSVTALAIEVDERDGDEATSVRQVGLGGELRVPAEAILPERPGITISPEDAERFAPPTPEFTFPDLDAERPSAPAMPEPRNEPVQPPFTYTPPPPPAERQRGPGTDCGTPTRSDGLDAERSAKAGNGSIALRVHPCHSFEWERIDHQVRFNVPGAATEKVVFDYGNGEVEEYMAPACNFDSGGRQEVFAGMPHRYETAGRYTLTARVTWVDCASEQRQTTTISIPVFRD